MYWSRKPEVPATTTFVSTTARCFFFLGFGRNGDLRNAPLRPVLSNRALDLVLGDISYIIGRIGECFQKLFFPTRALSPAR